MGMSYYYAGSASYPRFNEELTKVASVFGGVKVEYDKFTFPEGTDEVLIKFFNAPYDGKFTEEETEKLGIEFIVKHPEIKELSHQIWYEMGMRYINEEQWHINR